MKAVALVDETLSPETRRDDSWGAELARRVGVVVELLKMHFTGDAERSMFEELRTAAPHLMGKLERLSAEHGEILAGFREVAQVAPTVRAGDGEAARRVAGMAHKAIAQLRRHEAEENELVHDAIWQDVGSSD